MRSGHCSAIQSLAVCGAVAAETVAAPIDASTFRREAKRWPQATLLRKQVRALGSLSNKPDTDGSIPPNTLRIGEMVSVNIDANVADKCANNVMNGPMFYVVQSLDRDAGLSARWRRTATPLRHCHGTKPGPCPRRRTSAVGPSAGAFELLTRFDTADQVIPKIIRERLLRIIRWPTTSKLSATSRRC